jgi:chemotaxis-related protein WspD
MSDRRLIDRELPADYLDEWAAHIARPKQLAARGTASAVVFRLGSEWLAVPTAACHEVSARKPVHAIPHRRNGIVLGLVNVRGDLVLCVSLSGVLGVTDAPYGHPERRRVSRERLLLLGHDGQRLACPVTDMHGVYRYHPDDLGEVPATVAKGTSVYTRAVLPWQGKAVGLLDEQLLFYTFNRHLA